MIKNIQVSILRGIHFKTWFSFSSERKSLYFFHCFISRLCCKLLTKKKCNVFMHKWHLEMFNKVEETVAGILSDPLNQINNVEDILTWKVFNTEHFSIVSNQVTAWRETTNENMDSGIIRYPGSLNKGDCVTFDLRTWGPIIPLFLNIEETPVLTTRV